MPLTQREILTAKPGDWLSDGGPRGGGALLFRRTASGSTSVYFRYTLPDGKRDTMPIGQFDANGRAGLTLAQAREKAGELSRLYQSGCKDLRAHFEQEREDVERARREAEAQAAAEAAEAEIRQKYTLRALCDAYVDHLKTQGKDKSSRETASAFKCHVYVHAQIASTPAREVTPHQIATIVRKVREAGKERAAGILRSYLSASFNTAKRAPFDSSLPADLIGFNVEHNPVDNIPAIPVRAGKRVLSADEVRAYLAELGDDLADRALLLTLLIGGQRTAQLLRAKVSDFDPEANTLRLWDAKGRRREAREHLLPLAPRAVGIVTSLVERARKLEQVRAKVEERKPDMTGLWLFSSDGKKPMVQTTVGKRVAEASVALRGEPFDLRDIRRTCETMLAGMGVSREVRAQLLSHGISGVQAAHYDRHSYIDEKRAALLAWEARIKSIEKSRKAAPAAKAA